MSWWRLFRWIFIGTAVLVVVFGFVVIVAAHQAADEAGKAVGALGGSAGGDTNVAWSPDGRSLVVGRSEQSGDHLYRIPIATHDPQHDLQRLDPNQDGDFEPSVSPDGARLAFTRFDDDDGGIDLYVAAGDGSNPRALTHTTDEELDPAWSPDGRKIAFIRGDTMWNDLFVVTSDGSGLRRLTRNPREAKHHPSWSPDGRRIVYSTDYGDLDVIDTDGRHHKRLATAVGDGAAWSPDGRTVAFAPELGSLGLVTVDSGRVRLLPARGAADDLAWSPDGRRIAYASGGNIYITTVRGGQTRRLT